MATISHYRLEQEIGRGGMGVVHRAVDTRLGRAVAITLLPADDALDPERRRRFIQEARAAARGHRARLRAQMASALSAAHGAGIVHRDIKPGNVMITADGRAKVLDFSLAKLAERPGGDATVTAVGTRAGTILGTAAYMSPEQAQGQPADARSDLFSLGAVRR